MDPHSKLARLRRDLYARLWLRLAVTDRRSRQVLRGKPASSGRADGLLRVELRGLSHPLFVRPGTAVGSDRNTVWEIFCKHAYGVPGLDFAALHNVVDLGANVGLFLPYLLSRGADVRRYVAVDANDASLAVPRVNLEHASAGRGITSRVVSAAAGDHDGTARFDTRGQSIFHGVRDAGDREAPVRRLAMLLDESGLDDVDLLKIDIEGGEAAVLPTAGQWSARVRRIVGELHGLDLGWARRVLVPHGYRVADWTGRFGDNILAVREDG